MKVNITRQHENVDWLVIFFVLDTTDLKVYKENFFNELKITKLAKTTKIYFLQDTIHRIRDEDGFVEFKLQVSEFVFNNHSNTTTLEGIDLSDVDEKDGYAWLDAIRQIFTITNARFSSLITWSHGSGLGLSNILAPIKENDFNIVRNRQSKGMRFNKRFNETVSFGLLSLNTGLDRFSKSTKYQNAIKVDITPDDPDCLRLKQLFISEIADGLEDLTREKKFDLMIMCNCNTHVIDNVFNLSGIANYYFAPLGLVQLAGFHFPRFIEFINQPVELKNDEAYCSYFRSIFFILLEGYKDLVKEKHEVEAIVVSNLTSARKMKELIDPLSSFFRNRQKDIFPVVNRVLKEKISTIANELYDVMAFLKALREELNSAEFNSLVKPIEDLFLNKIVVKTMIGKKLLDKVPPRNLQSFTAWLPVDVTEPTLLRKGFGCQVLRRAISSTFVQNTKWDEFVDDFIGWQLANPV